MSIPDIGILRSEIEGVRDLSCSVVLDNMFGDLGHHVGIKARCDEASSQDVS